MAVTPVQVAVSTTVPTLTLAAGSAGGLAVASTIDPVNDYIPIYTASATATQGISRNTYLGISSAPVGLTDVQTVRNKILDNTNTVTLLDGVFTLQDDVAPTKQGRFQLSGITAGQTRTLTWPDATDTITVNAATQILSNKTLVSPTITSPNITNATISTDAVTGFTTSNSGNIYGISIVTGVFATSGIIGTTGLQTNAVQGNQLATNAIKLGSAKITSNFTGSATSLTLITGLSVTVIVPAGSRDLKITFSGSCSASASAGNQFSLDIYDSTTSTELGGSNQSITTASYTQNSTFVVNVPAPSAGSHIYQVRYSQTAAGTFTCYAGATTPALLLVELD